MPIQTHLEVHVLQHGRWSIHAQFAASQKEMAVEEGKILDNQPGIDAVKVIREVYDPTESTHRDYVIYKSADAPVSVDEEEASAGGHRGGGSSEWHYEDDDGGRGDDFGGTFGGDQFDADDEWDDAPKKKGKAKKKKKPTTITTLLIKLLLVTLFSICLAAIFTVTASTILHGTTLFGVKIVGNAEGNLLFLVFVSTFLISATAMAFTFLRGDTLADRQRKARNRVQAQAQARATRAAAKQQQQQQKKVEKKTRAAMEKAARDELDRAMEGIDEFKITEAEKEAEGEAASERLKEAIRGEDGGKEGAGDVIDPEAGAGTETLSPHDEKQKAYMMKFLGEALEGAQSDAKKLDNFNKFGVNLFLAGACETLAEKRSLDEDAHAKVLADSVRVMGFKKSHASTFANKYDEYLMQDARYMQMF